MKKFILVFLLFFVPFFVAGQNEQKNNIIEKPVSHQNISMRFFNCDGDPNQGTKTINVAVNQGEPFEVCTIRRNNSNKDATIEVDYNYAAYSLQGDKTCGNKSISDMIISNSNIKEFNLPGNNYIIKKFSILFPIGIEGQQESCMKYRVYDKNQAVNPENKGVGLIIRPNKGVYMDFFVGDLKDIKHDLSFNNIDTKLNQNKELILNFDIKNIGNLESSITISGHISNIFGFFKEFEIVGGEIPPTRTLPIEVNLGQVASYGGLFNIEFETVSKPYFNFDITKSNIDKDLLEEKTFSTKTSHFIIPRILIIITIIIIVLIITLLKKPKTKEKIVYIEKPQQ